MNEFQMNEHVLDFLLSGDPSIAYQTRKYLLEEKAEDLRHLQKETLLTGFGKRFFEAQHEDGSFGQSHYSGKWTSTHYTLLDLRYLEIPEETEKAQIPSRNVILQHPALDGGIAISSDKRSDLCVNGMYLNYACYFGVEERLLIPLVDQLLLSILPDGGFNCRYNRKKVQHSSMHTTLCVLEGFLEYSRRGYTHRLKEVETAMEKASEFLLMHHLFRSDRTGEIIDPKFLLLAFPTRWKYDIHRALYYFADAALPYDERMQEALLLLKEKRRKDGTFPRGSSYSGNVHFPLEEGRRGRFNTLRCLRILKAYGDKL
ncbi:hypothetical protein ACHAL6_02510 [Proteiniclasticum sp. C24MP]|uniref:hypothetical protein n=1 Tax=Proteiniclasticum sp. C24MP TaxID=3374101 RepID=UPI0037543724